MKSFRENNVELNYEYKHKDGVFLFAFDCRREGMSVEFLARVIDRKPYRSRVSRVSR